MIKRYKHSSLRRQKRVRSKIISSSTRPRLTVFRSNQQIYAQIINDSEGKTLVAAKSLKLKPPISKIDAAKLVGEKIAKLAIAKKISKVVFDRGKYKYHGRIKALAESARKAGLKF